MRKSFICGLLLLVQYPHLQAQQEPTSEEMLVLRRFVEYWKDGDYGIVKQGIFDFLDRHPDTGIADQLHAMLGDLYTQEGAFKEALAEYDQLVDSQVRKKIVVNYLYSAFNLQKFERVVCDAQSYLSRYGGDGQEKNLRVRQFLGDASLRRALEHPKASEERKKLLLQAVSQYVFLKGAGRKEDILPGMAEAYHQLEEHAEASFCYKELAQDSPQAERFLFQAAVEESFFDKRKAAFTFMQAAEQGGQQAASASMNALVLLFQEDAFSDFLSAYSRLSRFLKDKQKLDIQFYVGQCYFAQKEYAAAVSPLENFVSSTAESLEDKKAALFSLLHAAHYLEDIPLLDRTMSRFKGMFPGDLDLAKALVVHAQAHCDQGNADVALADLEQMASRMPYSAESAGLFYDVGSLLLQAGYYSESRKVFRSFVENFSEDSRIPMAWRQLLNGYTRELQKGSGVSLDLRQQFLEVLSFVLSRNDVLQANEREGYQLVQLRTMFELGDYDRAYGELMKMQKDVSHPKHAAEVEMLLACYYRNVENNPLLFIRHAENALRLDKSIADAAPLHLEVYNMCVRLQNENSLSVVAQRECQERAASHLLQSQMWRGDSLTESNVFWLMEHLYHKVTQEENPDATDVHNAAEVCEALLQRHGGWKDVVITKDNLFLEPVLLQYADIISLEGNKQRYASILRILVRAQENVPELFWQYKNQAKVLLGQVLFDEGEYAEGLKVLANLQKGQEDYWLQVGHLYKARLAFASLPKEDLRADSQPVLQILHVLKDLQIQRNVKTEPVHLQAGLDYVGIRVALSPEESKVDTEIFFLNRMKETLMDQASVEGQMYYEQVCASAEAKQVVTNYLYYIDGRIAFLKTKKLKPRSEAREQQQIQALTLLKKVSCGTSLMRDNVQEHIKQMLLELGKL